MGFFGEGIDPHAEVRAGKWRQFVFCLEPHSLEHEEWEDAAEREAKKMRYVQAAMHEQSMGRPGKKLHEMHVPMDVDALMCADLDTRAEWDALNPYIHLISSDWVNAPKGQKIVAETKQFVLKPSQGGMAHSKAKEVASNAGGMPLWAAPSLDPTQSSFVEHMSAWQKAYKSQVVAFSSNLPLPQSFDDSACLGGAVLLLGTAGTGKTTTLQAANVWLEQHGLEGRIVRCAYTGVAASNMGAGGRTLVCLFRLSKNTFGGGLQPLSSEDMALMAEELTGMCLLEIDEVSMIDKLVLAHVHLRLQQWRLAMFHDKHCRRLCACVCGARLAFGGVKLVLAGDFGQLPPVAVPPDRTLLNAETKSGGLNRQDVNLGLRLFREIRTVFRLRRIHRQVGQSLYKESLLRLRDAAHTKEDVQLWKTHDLTDLSACELPVEERRLFEMQGVHLFCENRRAGQFNGRRVGEEVAAQAGGHILRIWSVDSTLAVERYSSENYGGLRRVLHLAAGTPVMLTMNLRTVWNLVNGSRGKVVAVIPAEEAVAAEARSSVAAVGALAKSREISAGEVGGISVAAAEYVIVEFSGYVGPEMVAGHPTWVCIPKQTCRHEKFRSLARTHFPLVLCYGMTVHKSQGLTVSGRCVFNMEHEPTWSPFKNMCGLAFVGFSRVTDFSKMAFKYLPDYWVFQSMAETDMFRWRCQLEKRLDALHDQTAAVLFDGNAAVQDDVQRHRAWSERLNRKMLSEPELADLVHMLSLRGVLPQPGYTDKPTRGSASRSNHKTMRGAGAAHTSQGTVQALPEPDNLTMADDLSSCGEEVSKELELERQKILEDMAAEGRLHAERSQVEYENDLFEGGFSDEEDEIFRKMHEYD